MNEISIPRVPGRRGGARPGAGRPRKADVVLPPAGEMTHREASRRKEIALAELRELELGERRGELVTVASVRLGLTAIAAETRAALERLPDKLAEVLAAESTADRVHALLTAELDALLTDLAQQLAASA